MRPEGRGRHEDGPGGKPEIRLRQAEQAACHPYDECRHAAGAADACQGVPPEMGGVPAENRRRGGDQAL